MVAVAKALVSCKNNETVCRLLNYNNHAVTLEKRTSLAKIETLDKIALINEFREADMTHMDGQMGPTPSKTELVNFYKDYDFQISPSLGQDQKY